MNKVTIRMVLNRVEFWILLFFLIRMVGIINPPLEVAHNWRQTTGTMVARNFYETDANPFFPRVDFAGAKTGITGMEFPLLNYLIYLVSLVFGYAHWYGRLINLIVSSFGILYFFKIIRNYFTKEVALYSSLVLLSSIWFAYSRKIMPDTFSMSLVLMGFYFGTNYLESKGQQTLSLIAYFVFMLSGLLSKLPSGYILILFPLFFLNNSISRSSKLVFSITTLMLLIPVCWWYFYWVPYLVERFGFWHFFMGKSLDLGAAEIIQNLHNTLSNFYDSALKFIGFILFVAGVLMCFLKRNRRLQYILLLSFSGFSVIIFKSGFTFSHHSYYIIPFVPVMALFCGYAIDKMARYNISVFIVAAIMLEGILNQQHDFFLKKKEMAILSLEKNMDELTKRGDLILINSGDNPTAMYFAHRKGWIATNQQIGDEIFLNAIKIKGCKYIIILKQTFGTDMEMKYEKVFSNGDYSIFKL